MPLNLDCAFCGKQFAYDRPAGKTGRNPRCCSEPCYKAKELRRWREQEARRKAALVTVPCKTCGEPIPARGNRRCDPCRALAARAVRERENAGRSKERLADIMARTAERRAQEAQEARERHEQRERDRAGKPWLAPGLTRGEKYALRYRHDPEFRRREIHRAQTSERRKTKPIESALRYVLVRSGAHSGQLSLLGCTPEQLRQHLERQFTDGMTWGAFCEGRVHIAHVVRLSRFDLNRPVDVVTAWSLPNLRPLWAEENLHLSRKPDLTL